MFVQFVISLFKFLVFTIFKCVRSCGGAFLFGKATKRQNDKTTNALFRYYSKRYIFLFVGIISMDIMQTCGNGVSIGFCLVKSWNIGIVTVSKLSEM